MACPVEPILGTDPDDNTAAIQLTLADDGHARIPKGTWKVRPIVMPSNSRISGCGMGISKLLLELDNPGPFDSAAIISTVIPTPPPPGQPITYTGPVMVNDITLDGNEAGINWDNVINSPFPDGRAFGIWVRGCRDSIFRNIEILNCWTDGIMVTKDEFNATGQENDSRNCIFDNFIIKDCGRQGVSIVSGVELLLSNFLVERIGVLTSGFAKSPRAALDIEGANPNDVPNTTRYLTISNWTIRECGQAIVANGQNSFLPAEGLVISNIDCRDLNGVQLLRAEQFTGLSVSNFTCHNFAPVDSGQTPPDGQPMVFIDCKGTLSNISVFNATNCNSMIQLRGDDSDVELSNILIDGCSGPALTVGPLAGTSPAMDAASASISSFVFKNVYQSAPIPLGGTIQVRATGNVRLRHGVLRDSDAADTNSKEIQLLEKAYFEGVDVDESNFNQLFDVAQTGRSIGSTNSWNRIVVDATSDVDVKYQNNIHMKTNNLDVDLFAQANWSGNQVIVRNVGPTVTSTTVKFGATTLGTVSGQDAAMLIRSDGGQFFANSLS